MNRYEKNKAKEYTDILSAIAFRVTHMDNGKSVYTPQENMKTMKNIANEFPLVRKLGLGRNVFCPSCVSLEVIYKLSQLLGIEE